MINNQVNEKYYLKTLSTAFEMLEVLSLSQSPMGIVELSTQFGLQKSKVHRILNTLKHFGYVEQYTESKKYGLGTKVLELCNRKLDSIDLIKLVSPYMDILVNEVGETVHFGVLDGGKVLYLIKKQAPHAMGIISKVGQKLHAHCTGIGKTLLAFQDESYVDGVISEVGLPRYTKNTITDAGELKKELSKIRALGFGEDNEEISDGLCCIAVPVWDHGNKIAGAVSVSVPTVRIDEKRKTELKRLLLDMGEIVSKRLGYTKKYMT